MARPRTTGTEMAARDISVTQVDDRTAALIRAGGDGTIQAQLGPDASTADLVRDAIAGAKELMQLEVALAKNEIRAELAQAKASGVGFGVAGVLALEGVAMLLVALVLAISPEPLVALIVALVLFVIAGLAALVGYKAAPKKPMDRTRRRLQSDLDHLKERVA